jgi:hypothetical protein
VEIKGKNILKEGVAITSVQVTEKLSDSATFTLQISDSFDVNKEIFRWLDDPLFQLGNEITIKMGYGNNLQTMIIGKIETLNSSLFSNASPTLSVTGYDLSYKVLKKASGEQSFDNVKDSDIVQKIAGVMQLTAKTDPTSEKHEKVVKKSNTSFFNFLKERAERIGYEFYVGGRTLYFVNPKEDKAELFTLEWGKNLASFNPTMSTARVDTNVEVRGWDSKNKKEIIGRAGAGDERTQEQGKKKGSQIAMEAGGEAKRVIFWPVSSVEEANNVAKARLNNASDRFIEGTGNTIGIPELRSGVFIRLDKLGKRFSGKYRVKEATHTIDTSGYKVNFNVKRNAV